MRALSIALTLILVNLVTLGAALVYVIPDTPYDAMQHAEGHVSPVDSYIFEYPVDDSLEHETTTISLNITENDFENSMEADTIRYQSSLFSYDRFLTPEEPHVAKVAQLLLNLTPGGSDYLHATAALWFLQTSILYESDSDLYGISEYIAYPVETLYLHRGDCEDQALLLASIMMAMGLDCVLLDFPDHVAVAVDVGQGYGTFYTLEQGSYSYCEATLNSPSFIGFSDCTEEPEFIWPGTSGSFGWKVNELASEYRYLIQRIFSI